MRRLKLAALACIAAGSLGLPAAAAAQMPTEDSVVGSLSELGLRDPSYTIDVRSGPSGENVTGTVAYLVMLPLNPVTITTEPVCLRVSGNQATIVAIAVGPSIAVAIKVTVVDSPPGQPDQSESSITVESPVPTCDTPLTVAPVSGSITVTDAQPLPTTKQQCKNGGWRQYGVFRNQGDCVSFVATGGRNPPATNQP
jgi:hypothetical protein